MIDFINGKKYQFSAKMSPPGGRCVPFITLILINNDRSEPVTGKMDTGAFRTMLNENTAVFLGIELPPDDSPGVKKCGIANGNKIPYWEHQIYFWIESDEDNYVRLPIRAGFSRHVTDNLFGCDFLHHFCLGIDQKSVHFLR